MHEPQPTAGLARAQSAGVSTTRSARVALALIAAMVATLLGGLPSAAGVGSGPAATTDALTRVVVQAQQDVGAAAAAVVAQGGRILEVLDPFGIVVADVPADAVATLESDAATAAVTEDFPLRVQSADAKTVGKAKGPATPTAGGDAGAGDGVGIVVVDTGIADHPDLAGRVAARYDLATGKGKKDASFDPHGHGTFLAGLAAGSGATDQAHAGAAPAAHLVSVRVAEPDGSTTLARVLHGLAVADAARIEHDAPVVLLALAGPTGDVPDPIMMVLEMLWSRGSTVVVAAGNQGDQLTSPGADPYLLTVGAFGDVNGTPDDPTDDTVPGWSSRGEKWNITKPDLVAPGVSVVGLRSPGSAIDVANPEARVGDEGNEQYFLGSGTSMAAAWTAGAAAAVLASSPTEMTPDEVKGRLTGTATAVSAGVEGAGAGVLDLDAALDSTSTSAPANTDLPPLPVAVNPDQTHARVTAPGQLRRTANGIEPAAWTWTAWTWTAWTWTGWEWTAPDDQYLDGDLAAWTWTDDEWAAWTWTEDEWGAWTWTAWTWTDAEWAAWTWTAWTWTAWTWTAHDWGTPGGS